MKRREFLEKTLLGLAAFYPALAIAKSSLSTKKPRHLLIGSWGDRKSYVAGVDRKNMMSPDISGEVRILDPITNVMNSIPIQCFGHSFCQSPKDRNVIATSAKWAPHGAVVDVESNKVVQNLTCPDGYRYFGHGRFDEDGFLYLSGASNVDNAGRLFIYEPKNWTLAGELKTGGKAPHDFHFLDSNKIIVANSRSETDEPLASLGFINKALKKVEKVVPVSQAAHLCPIDADVIAVGDHRSGKERGAFFTYNHKTGMIINPAELPHFNNELLQGEPLSLLCWSPQHLALTTGDGHYMLLWDIANNRIMEQQLKFSANGIARFNEAAYISTSEGELLEYSLTDKGFSENAIKKLQSTFSNTAHLFEYKS